MRRLLLTLIVAFLATVASATVVWDSMEWDFGTIKEVDGPARHAFVCRNMGPDTIEITRTRSSCGCTTANYTHGRILPGDSAIVTLEFNPSYRPGPFTKHVVVYLGEARNQLEVSGKVIPVGETVGRIFPEKLGDLRLTSKTAIVGDIKQGHRRLATINAYNASSDTLALAFQFSDPRLYVDSKPIIVHPSELTAISISIASRRSDDTGRVEMPIEVYSGNKKEGTITAVAQIVPANPEKVDYASAPKMRLADDRIDFSPIGKKKITRKLQVESVGKADLHITGVESMSDAVVVKKWPKSLKPGKSGEIVVVFDPTKLADKGLLNSSIVVFTNDPLQATVQVRTVGAEEK